MHVWTQSFNNLVEKCTKNDRNQCDILSSKAPTHTLRLPVVRTTLASGGAITSRACRDFKANEAFWKTLTKHV